MLRELQVNKYDINFKKNIRKNLKNRMQEDIQGTIREIRQDLLLKVVPVNPTAARDETDEEQSRTPGFHTPQEMWEDMEEVEVDEN